MGDSDIRVVFIGLVGVPIYRRRCPRIAGQLVLVVSVLVGVLISVLVGVLTSFGGSVYLQKIAVESAYDVFEQLTT